MRTPAVSSVLHFTDGHWQQTPRRTQVDEQRCLGADGKIVAGGQTETHAWSLQPQPDGTLRGVQTTTVLTSECGHQGEVVQDPVLATRTGDVPAGVTVADPAGVTASTPTNTPAPPAPGPVLDGAYRFDYDFPDQTINGRPATGPDTMETHWWAFRSLCTSTRCVATGAPLADNNLQEPYGTGAVLEFTDGRWQTTPYPQHPLPCNTGSGADTSTISLSLKPQPDGTLRGVSTMTVLTNECGRKGNVYKTPIAWTRIGDVPPAVILADPALFES
jgi:hypothetical protein